MDKIISRKNKLAMHMKKLGASRSYRSLCREYLCDGKKLLYDAVASDVTISAVLTSSSLPAELSPQVPVYCAERDIIDSISPLKTPQDTLFICKMDSEPTFDFTAGNHILLDGIQDPGNMGTIIRTADAFGFDSVILTGSCADIYNPKTIRASMGAIFRQKLFELTVPEISDIKKSMRIVGTAPDRAYSSISEVDLDNCIIAVGNEGSGLSEAILNLCGENFIIPIQDGCQSLNAAAAAAVIMWESVRRRGS